MQYNALRRLYLNRIYRDIDFMPIYSWQKLHETADMRFMLIGYKQRKKQPGKVMRYLLSDSFAAIQNQFVARFGLSSEYADYLNKRREILELRREKIVSGDDSIETIINIAQAELEQMKKSLAQTDSFNEIKANMEQALGFQINPLTVSVSEFYSYISSLNKRAQRQKQK